MDIDAYEITADIVQRDAHQIAGFLRYVEWMAKEGEEASVQQTWAFFEGYIREGRHPDDLAMELGLPVKDW